MKNYEWPTLIHIKYSVHIKVKPWHWRDLQTVCARFVDRGCHLLLCHSLTKTLSYLLIQWTNQYYGIQRMENLPQQDYEERGPGNCLQGVIWRNTREIRVYEKIRINMFMYIFHITKMYSSDHFINTYNKQDYLLSTQIQHI